MELVGCIALISCMYTRAAHFCTELIDAGVPLWRVNIGQRFANPLLVAWGVVWTTKKLKVMM